jgi:diadenosine tetraphosphate (Ap4A) HIT family hydrolase
MKDFLSLPPERIIHQSEFFFVVKDGFPVSPGHCLIISKALRKDFFHLSEEEKAELPSVIEKTKSLIEGEHSPDGYNIGMNCGEAAGQTVFHFHCHVIPRFKGDMENPRGGVRYCIPSKGNYPSS